jgi:hypothetical protein
MSLRRPGDLVGDVDDLSARVAAIERILANSLPRIIYGIVSSTGAVSRGTGFSSVKNSTGNYTVTYTTPFVAAPVALVSSVSGVIARISGAPSTTAFTISTLDAAFANADFDTAFVIIGV